MRHVCLIVMPALVFACLSALPTKTATADLAYLEQQSVRAAIDAVSDSVVQIRTVGGLERVEKTLIAKGPTTGLIVSSDGYIVSSAFNFAQQPTSILVRLPDASQVAAKLIARDTNRMLVLLKVETDVQLSVPAAVPQDQIQVGNWAIALGRTFQADRVGVSTGIISGTNRMYGRVLQTDASISVANYGGPLVDLRGMVYGILVPMAPQSGGKASSDELAGAEFYDSGIGFAVPLEHVFAMLPRWQQSEDLLPGKLGIAMVDGNPHLQTPKITYVWPSSPAALAGWQSDDVITSINHVEITTQSQLRFQVTPRYAGESLLATVQRGDQSLETQITLAGELAPYELPFLGILPGRTKKSESGKGILVRSVWPESPAALAGLQAEDRLLKIEQTPIGSIKAAIRTISQRQPAESVQLTVLRQQNEISLSAELATLPEEILSASALPVLNVAIPNEEKRSKHESPQAQPVLQPLKLPTFTQESHIYAPAFDKTQRIGLLVWLGKGQASKDSLLLSVWQEACQRLQMALVIARPQEDERWTTEDLKYLDRLVSKASKQIAADPNRVAIAGAGKAGQLALALALSKPNVFGGAVGIDSPLPRTFSIPKINPNSRVALLVVESTNSSLGPLIRRDVQRLRDVRYPVSWLNRPPTSDVVAKLDNTAQENITRWIDSLDRF